VVGVGNESTPEQMVYQTAHALAERLGGQPAQFPGGHGGFGRHPGGFADRLREVLASGHQVPAWLCQQMEYRQYGWRDFCRWW
jgi:hypothetical protein